MIVLDTSFLVSFYLTADTNHDRALKVAEENANEKMILSDAILFETLTVLNYKGGIGLAKEAYNELMDNRQIRFFHLTNDEKDEVLYKFFDINKDKKGLSYSDVSVIYLAKKSNSGVLAFDKEIFDNV